MQYEGAIYRPPSEAYSLIIQATVGCTHNKCTFCTMYKDKKFRMKPFETVLADLEEARKYYRRVDRIFLADGDAMCMATDKLTRLLATIRELYPECSRIGIYSRASHILGKSMEDLVKLREAGIGIVYIGAESGSDKVLLRINKGETAAQLTEAVHKAESAGIQTSVTFIAGLGGKELMEEHAAETGEVITDMGASYVGILTLLIAPEAPLYEDKRSGKFVELSPIETMQELEIMLEHTNCKSDTVFRSNHASNLIMLAGTLPQDRERMLQQIREAKSDTCMLRHHGFRSL